MRHRLRTAGLGLLLILCGTTWLASPAAAQDPAPKDPGAPIRDAQHQFQRHVVSWREAKRQNVVMQQRDYSCGAAALATLLRYYWDDRAVSEKQILVELDKMLTREEALDRIKNGLSLTDLRRAAVKLGYRASMGRVEFAKLSKSLVPLVVGIKVDGYRHFVVYRGTDGQYVYVADPMRGNIRLPIADFVRNWQENAVLAVAKPGEGVRDVSPLTVRDEEKELGELNHDVVEKTYLKTPAITSVPPLR